MRLSWQGRFLFLAIPILFIGGQAAPETDHGPDSGSLSLRVMTYNIHHAAGNEKCPSPAPSGPDCGLNLDRVAEVIRAQKPDIVGLQEVDRFWARSGGVDQAQHLARALGMKVCYGANLDHGPDAHAGVPHQYGTATLSRFPILECSNTLLPQADPGSEQRGLLTAVIDVRRTRLRFHNTHLHTLEADRAVQVRTIAGRLEPQGETTVLAGDLNAMPAASSLGPLCASLADAWATRGVGDGFTFPAHPQVSPGRRIDYIFVSRGIVVSGIKVPMQPQTGMASDHYPVVADLLIQTSR